MNYRVDKEISVRNIILYMPDDQNKTLYFCTLKNITTPFLTRKTHNISYSYFNKYLLNLDESIIPLV